jgi:hypothetical protein
VRITAAFLLRTVLMLWVMSPISVGIWAILAALYAGLSPGLPAAGAALLEAHNP